MKICINGESIMKAALKKAAEEEYFEALCLFAQVDSYESMLNQIGCHVMIDYLGYANELCRKLLARYVYTHNCIADLKEMGSGVARMLDCYYNALGGAFTYRDPNKLSADIDLLGNYAWEEDEEDEPDIDYDGVQELLDILKEGSAPRKSQFAEVGSKEYEEMIRDRVISALMSANMKEIRKRSEDLFEIVSYDPATLELQIMLCYHDEDWKRGAAFAKRLADCGCASLRGMSMAVEILYHANCNKRAMRQLLTKLAENGDDISDEDLALLIKISANSFGYGKLTLSLTDVLYRHYRDAGCTSLRLCARVYNNCKLYSRASEAALMLMQSAPWDSVGKALRDFGKKRLELSFSDPLLPENDLLNYFDIPDELAFLCNIELMRRINDGRKLATGDFYLFDLLTKVCNKHLIMGNIKAFSQQCAAICGILSVCVPEETKPFIILLKECLLNILPDVELNRAYISKLIELGYGDNVYVAYAEGFYTLDLSKLTLREDKRFCTACAYCAALYKVDVRKLEKAYGALAQKIDLSDSTNRAVAYALLAISYKSFTKTRHRDFFAEEETQLYQRYLAVSE